MKLTKIINEETSPAVKKSIQKIERYTSDNDHSYAVLELAKLVGNQMFVKIVKHISDIRDLEGHLPHHLGKYRNEIRDELLDLAKKKFDDETYKAIYNAF
jgi:hypothetical protein